MTKLAYFSEMQPLYARAVEKMNPSVSCGQAADRGVCLRGIERGEDTQR